MFIDRGMDKENVAYVHTHTKEYYSAIKKERMPFAANGCTWRYTN